MIGCGAILHPERSLVPEDKRGPVDGVVLAIDIFLSLGLLPWAIIGAALSGQPYGISNSKPVPGRFWMPIWIDHKHGTLYYPKNSSAKTTGRK